MRALVLGTIVALTTGCVDAGDLRGQPAVQASSGATPRWTVDLNRVRDGVYRAYAPRCLDKVKPGETVEFRNFMPEVPANVTGIAGPEPVFSPNLVRPYNYVGPEAPENTLCERNDAAGGCAERPAWSYWRRTFSEAGVYDWIDTNQGAPGRKVVDPYYGTETFIGMDPDSPTGTVCVQKADGSGCDGVCCTQDDDCGRGTRCFREEVDVVGRCRTP